MILRSGRLDAASMPVVGSCLGHHAAAVQAPGGAPALKVRRKWKTASDVLL